MSRKEKREKYTKRSLERIAGQGDVQARLKQLMNTHEEIDLVVKKIEGLQWERVTKKWEKDIGSTTGGDAWKMEDVTDGTGLHQEQITLAEKDFALYFWYKHALSQRLEDAATNYRKKHASTLPNPIGIREPKLFSSEKKTIAIRSLEDNLALYRAMRDVLKICQENTATLCEYSNRNIRDAELTYIKKQLDELHELTNLIRYSYYLTATQSLDEPNSLYLQELFNAWINRAAEERWDEKQTFIRDISIEKDEDYTGAQAILGAGVIIAITCGIIGGIGMGFFPPVGLAFLGLGAASLAICAILAAVVAVHAWIRYDMQEKAISRPENRDRLFTRGTFFRREKEQEPSAYERLQALIGQFKPTAAETHVMPQAETQTITPPTEARPTIETIETDQDNQEHLQTKATPTIETDLDKQVRFRKEVAEKRLQTGLFSGTPTSPSNQPPRSSGPGKDATKPK